MSEERAAQIRRTATLPLDISGVGKLTLGINMGVGVVHVASEIRLASGIIFRRWPMLTPDEAEAFAQVLTDAARASRRNAG